MLIVLWRKFLAFSLWSEQQRIKKRQKRQEARTEETETKKMFNKQGAERRRAAENPTERQTGMQEASDWLYSTEEKQAGETEKHNPLTKHGN